MTLSIVGLKALRCLSRDVDGNDPEDFPLWFKRIRKEGSLPESIAPFERRSMPADDFLGTGLTTRLCSYRGNRSPWNIPGSSDS